MPEFLQNIMIILFCGWLSITVIAGAALLIIKGYDRWKQKQQGPVNHG